MKFVILLITFTYFNISFAKEAKVAPTAMNAKWHKLMTMIDDEMKTINSLRKLGPKLKYRLVELKSEKLKLIKERENKIFLHANFKEIKLKGKKSYFSSSHALYKEIKDDALKIINQWPRFRYNPEIYYTLALNSRDYGGDKETEYFLHKSLKIAPKHLPIVHLAKTSLAEYYYNAKKYKKAIRYYEDVLKKKDDEWYSKHLYNVSWCYLKIKKYGKGIEGLREAFTASQEKEKYINVTDQVLESIGLFYILDKRVEEGADFYVENVAAPGTYMIRMAKKAANDGSFKDTHYLLKRALTNAESKGQLEEQITIRLSELDFYRNFKRMDLYFQTAQGLYTLDQKQKFKPGHQKEAVDKIKSLVGFMQVRLSKNKKIGVDDYDPADLKRIIDYFDILASLDEKNISSYRFFQGETYFSISQYEQSFQSYKKALTIVFENEKRTSLEKKIDKGAEKNVVISAKSLVAKEDETKLKRKLLDSMLAILENAEFNKKTRFEYTVFTYTNHLKIWPVDDKSQIIYRKLFNLYLENKLLDDSIATLELYRTHYARDIELQRAMLTQVFDYYIKEKDSDKLSIWTNKISKGYLSFDKDYIEKATTILGKILFENFQKMDTEGNKKEAATGYISLYENEKYPKKIKARAAFNASLLYLDLGQTEKSYEWLQKSKEKHTTDDFYDLRSKMFAMSERYYLLQDFTTSIKMSNLLLNTFCARKYEKKETLYQNIVYFNLLEDNFDGAYENLGLADKCGIKKELRAEMLEQLIQFTTKNRKYQKYVFLYKKHGKNSKYTNEFIKNFLNIYWDSKYLSRSRLSSSIKTILVNHMKGWQGKPDSQIREIKAIIDFESFENWSNKQNLPELVAKENFDEKNFNTQLENQLNTLKNLTDKGKEQIKSKNGHIVLSVYRILENAYIKVADNLNKYTPQGVPSDFVSNFKAQMRGLSANLIKEGRTYHALGNKVVLSSDIYGTENLYFSNTPESLARTNTRYPASNLVMPMDMGGLK